MRRHGLVRPLGAPPAANKTQVTALLAGSMKRAAGTDGIGRPSVLSFKEKTDASPTNACLIPGPCRLARRGHGDGADAKRAREGYIGVCPGFADHDRCVEMDPQAVEHRESEMGRGKGRLERLPDAGESAKFPRPQKLAVSLRLHDEELTNGLA